MTTISTLGTNESTYIITATFTDSDGTEVTPNSVVWSLTNDAGTIINSRDDVSETPDTTIEIVLSGDDLDVTDGLIRIITIEAVYNSVDYGNNLPLNKQAKFTLDAWVEEV